MANNISMINAILANEELNDVPHGGQAKLALWRIRGGHPNANAILIDEGLIAPNVNRSPNLYGETITEVIEDEPFVIVEDDLAEAHVKLVRRTYFTRAQRLLKLRGSVAPYYPVRVSI